MAIAMKAATTGGGILCSSAGTRIQLMPNVRVERARAALGRVRSPTRG